MKISLIAVFMLFITGASQPAKENANEILEVVVYKIKPQYLDTYTLRLDELHALMKNLKGFISIQTFQSQDVRTQFVDQCLWESLTDAQKAAQDVNAMPEFQIFFAMMDTVIYFDQPIERKLCISKKH